MKSNTILTVAFATLAAALPAQKSQGVNKSPRASAKTNNVRQEQSSSGKKGLAYVDAGVLDVFASTGAVQWSYDWSPNPDSSKVNGVPMCWGAGVDCKGDQILPQLGQGGESWVLGYNEPDLTKENGGSFLTPKQAHDAWGDDMFQFADAGAKLVCPGVSSYDTESSKFTGFESGLTWLRSFVSLSGSPKDLRCDAVAVHWYGEDGKSGGEQADLFIDYMDNAHTTLKEIFGQDISVWVTEYGPLPENNVQVLAEFTDKAVPYLEKQGWIARYSPFKPEQMTNGGGLNDAGKSFMSPKASQ